MTKKQSVTFEASQELVNQIDLLAKQRETSRATIIRMALQEYIDVRKRPILPPLRKPKKNQS